MSGARAVVAVIPARRGSKGLPLKNLRLLNGVPLIAHSIRAALAATSIDAVVVSTEDEEIEAVAAAHGATVVRRPAELAIDTVQNTAVVRHVIESSPGKYRYVVLLQPTSPLRRPAHIDACVEPVVTAAARSAMTITLVDQHPGKAVHLDGAFVEPFTTDADMEAQRQNLREVYRQNGAVYAVGVADFLEHDRFYLRPCHGVVVPAEDSVDIDTEIDLMLAELILQRRRPTA
jgi:CMP-N-acetylneuraminic acid synthetase